MNQTQIIIAIVLVVVVAACFYILAKSSEKSDYEAAKDSLEIQPGPIRNEQLSSELIDRIRRLQSVFAEVYPLSHQEWLDGFQRDTAPEKEVALWEQMAAAYATFVEANDVGPAARKEAFGLLLIRSTTSDVDAELSRLEHLTLDQGKSLVDLYEANPMPVTYQSSEQSASDDAD